jgi:hypothetical protein
MKTVIVRVPRKGITQGKAGVEVDAVGFQGQSCKTATQAFTAIGAAVDVEDKPELYQSDSGQEFLQEGE